MTIDPDVVRRIGEHEVDTLVPEQSGVAPGLAGVASEQPMASQQPYVVSPQLAASGVSSNAGTNTQLLANEAVSRS